MRDSIAQTPQTWCFGSTVRLVTTSVACPRCGTQPREGARFCDGCGLAIADGDALAERKQVTVLFADVVRSMDLAAVLDAERLREVMGQLFNRCGSVVQRYGGTVDKFTGDGLMALFGAPIALEDHAVRACAAALELQVEVGELAAELARSDGVTLSARVGLNSGEVVAGQIDSSSADYTAVGEQVGLAQRMESVAEPGGVMLSVATAQLVEAFAQLGPTELVQIKGSAQPVAVRRLLRMVHKRTPHGRRESTLSGRDVEMAEARSIVHDAVAGRSTFVAVVGPPGIGKSRMCREIVRLAEDSGAEIFSSVSESHSADIPFSGVTQLWRDLLGLDGLDEPAARSEVRSRLAAVNQEDVVLLEDLLGIRAAEDAAPSVSTEARRRRLIALLKNVVLGRETPSVYVVEDVHWLDEASETMLGEVFEAITGIGAVVVVTYRPHYVGPLARVSGQWRLVLGALDDAQARAMAIELLGTDPSVAAIADRVVEQAAGNPFYVQELIREFAGRGVLAGARGGYRCDHEISGVTVPPTLQATIAARIDRLTARAKRTLNAASVIGSRFDAGLLSTVLSEPEGEVRGALAELVHGELIDQVLFSPRAEYVLRHPLVRAVAYESQLRGHRAKLHRRLAVAIESRNPAAAEENSTLIASHLESAGDLREAFGWHMRAGTWWSNRDIGAARASWSRAKDIADSMPMDEPDRALLRSVPRSLLCGSAWRAGGTLADTGLDELREICSGAANQVPLAVGMAGLISQLSVHGEFAAARSMFDEYLTLLESLHQPLLIVGLSYPVIHAKYELAELADVVELAQRVIELSHGDPTSGNFLTGSPLSFALAMRASARCGLGLPGWRADFDSAVEMSHRVDPTTYVTIVMFKYVFGLLTGCSRAGPRAHSDTADALAIAGRCSEDFALHSAELARGMVLLGGSEEDREAALGLLESARTAGGNVHHFMKSAEWVVDLRLAQHQVGRRDLDSAITLSRSVIERQDACGAGLYRGAAAEVLVEALLKRATPSDLDEAWRVCHELAELSSGPGFVLYEYPLLRSRALLARAQGDSEAAGRFMRQHRAMAAANGFDA